MRALQTLGVCLLVGCHFSPSGTSADGDVNDGAPTVVDGILDGGDPDSGPSADLPGPIPGRRLIGRIEALGPHDPTSTRRLTWAGLEETAECTSKRCLRGTILP